MHAFLGMVATAAALIGLVGCRATSTEAVIAVWQPPALRPAGDRIVVIESLVGDPAVVQPLREALLDDATGDLPGLVDIRDARQSHDAAPIALVSALTGSDGTATLPRSEPDNALRLRGEVLPPPTGAARRHTAPDNPRPLRMAWRLVDPTDPAATSAGQIIRVDPLSETSEPLREQIQTAADRVVGLVGPSLRRDTVRLMGAAAGGNREGFRRAGEAAANGQWPVAEKLYRDLLTVRPRDHAAMHNLALCRVAAQDFTTARQWIAKALKRRADRRTMATAQWIEATYRNYRLAFGASAEEVQSIAGLDSATRPPPSDRT